MNSERFRKFLERLSEIFSEEAGDLWERCGDRIEKEFPEAKILPDRWGDTVTSLGPAPIPDRRMVFDGKKTRLNIAIETMTIDVPRE